MKAVILAAGKGTRMKELTNARPKPMLYVQGKPILQHIIEGLKGAGISDLFIVTGYKAEVIEDYFKDGTQFGIKISYGRQVVQDGTGRAPLVAREFIGRDTFLLTYGDILVKPYNYIGIVEKFASGAYDGLITVTRGEDFTKGGLLFFNNDFLLEHLVEKPTPEQIDGLKKSGYIGEGKIYFYNAGIYVFKPIIFKYIEQIEKSPRGEYELTDAILKLAQEGNKLVGFEIEGRWVDVRDPVVLAKLESEQPI
ncbi:MAG: nucleotidyltransferase family protein [Verrucomicrobiia bacterium]|jgi:dTDP-glucose pyrophosphorylase